MTTLEKINEHPVYKQIMADSFGGIMYNVANRDKYDTKELLDMWHSMPAVEREIAGGIVKGAFNFLEEK